MYIPSFNEQINSVQVRFRCLLLIYSSVVIDNVILPLDDIIDYFTDLIHLLTVNGLLAHKLHQEWTDFRLLRVQKDFIHHSTSFYRRTEFNFRFWSLFWGLEVCEFVVLLMSRSSARAAETAVARDAFERHDVDRTSSCPK